MQSTNEWIGWASWFSSSTINGATSQYCLWSRWKWSWYVSLRAMSVLLWRIKGKIKLDETVLSENYFFSLIPRLAQKRKARACFIPNHPEVRGVDIRVLCNTELCRNTESLIFIQQHCPGSFANVVILFPSYMQHFPVTAQSHDQTLTQSDNAHSNHSAGLWTGTAVGMHTYSYSVNCLGTDFRVQGILDPGNPHLKALLTCIWCTMFLQQYLCNQFVLLVNSNVRFFPLYQSHLLVLLLIHWGICLS